MARLLAVDWNSDEAHYVLATAQRQKLIVESMGTVRLNVTEPEPGREKPDPLDFLGPVLKEGLDRAARSKPTVIATLDRTAVEILHFSVPAIEEWDLPDLVKNLAMRESSQVTEDSLIDFVTLRQTEESRDIMAAALTVEQQEKIKDAFQQAGLSLDHLLLRPYASASFVARATKAKQATCLIVHSLESDVDLIVTVDQQPAYWRTVRLPKSDDTSALDNRLAAEISRTIVAAEQQLNDGAIVESIIVIGTQAKYGQLVERLAEQTSLPTSLFDPLDHVEVPPQYLPDHPERFTPLFGALSDALSGGAHTLDLINPRQAPKQPDKRRPLIMIAGTVAVIAGMLGFMMWRKLADLDQDIRDQYDEYTHVKTLHKAAQAEQTLVKTIENWESENIIWLDEIRDLSRRFPSARDAIVLQMTGTHKRDGQGLISMRVRARSPGVIQSMEDNLRDEYRQPSNQGVREGQQGANYTWQTEESIVLKKKRRKEDYADASFTETTMIESSDDTAAPAKPSEPGSKEDSP